MPHTQQHRGPHPKDHQLFTEDSLRVLRLAREEAQYLLDRGYATESVLDVVSRRHELRVRQRSALQRSMCSSIQAKTRRERAVTEAQLRDGTVEIDGFNLVIWIEVALSKGLLLRGGDGAYRDLAGLRGSYHLVEETELALKLLGTVFYELRVQRARFYLDQPVSNSGRLKERMIQHSKSWTTQVEVLVVRNPDRELLRQAVGHFERRCRSRSGQKLVQHAEVPA